MRLAQTGATHAAAQWNLPDVSTMQGTAQVPPLLPCQQVAAANAQPGVVH